MEQAKWRGAAGNVTVKLQQQTIKTTNLQAYGQLSPANIQKASTDWTFTYVKYREDAGCGYISL